MPTSQDSSLQFVFLVVITINELTVEYNQESENEPQQQPGTDSLCVFTTCSTIIRKYELGGESVPTHWS